MKKIIRGLIVGTVVTCLTISPLLAATKFADVASNNWAKANIESVAAKGLMQGTVSGSKTYFKPNDKINAYECLAVIARMLGSAKADTTALVAKHRMNALELYSVPQWCWKEIAFCIEKGIVSPYDLQAFKKSAMVMKKDIITFIGRGMGVTETTGNSAELPYKDAKYIDSRYVPHIKFLLEQGVLDLNTKGDTNLNPGYQMDRATFAKIIDTASDAYVKLNDEGKKPVTAEATVEGKFVSATDKAIVIKVEKSEGMTADETYPIGSDVICNINGTKSVATNIMAGDKVILTLSDNSLVKISATSSVDGTKGSLVSTRKDGSKEYISIKLENGQVVEYLLKEDLTSTTGIIKDNNPSYISAMEPGNLIELKLESGMVVFIQATTKRETGSGQLMAKITELGKMPVIKVKLDNSEKVRELVFTVNTKLKLDGKTTIDGKDVDVNLLREGMQVNYTIQGEELMLVEALRIPDSMKILGTITEKSIQDKTITVSYYNQKTTAKESKEIHLDKAMIKNSSDFTSLTMLDLSIGDVVFLVIAEEKDVFYAKSVVL